MAPISAFSPLLGLIPTPKPARVKADAQKRPSHKRPARGRRHPSRKRAPTPGDATAPVALARTPRATISPAPRVMNALVTAWLADATLHAPKVTAVHLSTPTDAAVSHSVMARLLAAVPWRRQRAKASPADSAPPTTTPVTAEAVPDSEEETAAHTSALYRSLYFSATTRGDGGASARALAEQLRCDAETCARDAARIGARAVPAFLLADQSPAGVDLLEEVRAVWRRKADSARNPFARIISAISLAPFLLNPLRH